MLGRVVENTKEYICRALVTVVDHLGNVSANLDNCIPNPFAFSEAELRINTLKQVSLFSSINFQQAVYLIVIVFSLCCIVQRLLSCELYVHKLALNRVKWNPALTIYHRRYLSARNCPEPSLCLCIISLQLVSDLLNLILLFDWSAITDVSKSNVKSRYN